MTRGVDSEYFDWLYSRFGALSDKNPSHTYHLLATQLVNHEFEWFVPNDDNRAFDGLMLRETFLDQEGLPRSALDHFGPCSVLEMMIALTEHLVFETTGTDIEHDFGSWFWILLCNLGLEKYHDDILSGFQESVEVSLVIERLVLRQYEPDGRGGLFPLRDPPEDQRDVEIWYQAGAYILEQSDIGD